MFNNFLSSIKVVLISIFLVFNMSILQAKHHECDIIIKNKDFQSGTLSRKSEQECIFTLKSGVKHKIRICNKDSLPMEFESHDLRREKVIKANKSALISLPVLKKGKKYNFFEEFYGKQCFFEAS